MRVADSSSEITFKLWFKDECQHKWRSRETCYTHEDSKETESQHNIDIENIVADSITADEAYYKNNCIKIVIWYLKYVWEPSLCNNLNKVCNNCRDKYTCKDKHSQIMLLYHK